MSLEIGNIALSSPVILAPMAGVTNVAFRSLCREQEVQRTGTVSGLYVCEMVTARALVERNEKTMKMTTFAPDEDPRSLQLYTVDPEYTYKAAKMIVDENLADHIDMNFGCPVPKITAAAAVQPCHISAVYSAILWLQRSKRPKAPIFPSP